MRLKVLPITPQDLWSKADLDFPSDSPAVISAAVTAEREAVEAGVDFAGLLDALSGGLPSPTCTDDVNDWIAAWPVDGGPPIKQAARSWLLYLAACFQDVWFMEPNPPALRQLLKYHAEFWSSSRSDPLARAWELTIQNQFRILWLVTASSEFRAVRQDESRAAIRLFFDITFRSIYRLLGTDLDSDTRDDHASAIAERLVARMRGCQHRKRLLFENPYALRAYLKKIVHREILASELAEKRRRELLQRNSDRTRYLTTGEASLDSQPQRRSLDVLIEDIKVLATPEQLEVFLLHLAGLTSEQISRQLNISERAAHMRLSRLKERAENELTFEGQQR